MQEHDKAGNTVYVLSIFHWNLMILIMISIWGAAGAALATTIAEFLVLFVQMIFARDLLVNAKAEVHALKYMALTTLAAVPTIAIMNFTGEKYFFELSHYISHFLWHICVGIVFS